MSSCDVFTCLFCSGCTKLNTASAAVNVLLLFLAGLFIGLWLRNAPLDKNKSEIIVFKNKLLLVSLLHLALKLLDGFASCISTGKLE